MRRIIVAITACVGMLIPTNVNAGHIPCENTQVTNVFVGYYTFDDNVTGAKGTIRDRKVKLCVNTTYSETSAGAAWVMLSGAYSDEHAQIGYFQRSGMSNEEMFTEWAWEGDWDRKKHYGIFDPGKTHAYKAKYTFDQGIAQMLKGGVVYDSTPFDPAIRWTAPWEAFFAGETWDHGDHVPGTTAYKADFTNTAVRTCRGCGYHTSNSNNYTIQDSDYGFQWVNRPAAFNIWTEGT